ncbi:MAG TPA: alpha-amylase family glycosyl hydrolase [Anaerolineaceae bacterium]|nr:alpha-amylase family glycosyl hydrolase [Anaerolineaceae bacterium]
MTARKLTLRFFPILILLVTLASCISLQTQAPTSTSSPLTLTSFPTDTPSSLLPTEVPPSPIPISIPTSVSDTGTDSFPWWNNTVFYEVFVRSFYDSNGNGKGDFNGLTSKLDYLKSLGISGIWLMPIYPSPSYHGYDVTDFYGVNPDYGTMDDFKNFLNEAHKRGIRVIIDFVLNHTSDQHPWFQASLDSTSKFRNWYIWSDTNPGYLGPWGEKVWHPGPNGGFYYGIFTAQMPDLNYNNPDVTQEMEKNVQFWLKDTGIDGFRLDAAQHLIEEGKNQANTPSTHTWYKQFRTFYKGVNPQAMTVGEVQLNSFIVSTYVNKVDQLDLAFDFDQAQTWVNGVLSGDAKKLENSTNFEHSIFPKDQIAIFLTNHDQNRVMSQLGDNVNKAKAAAAILLTAPGVPFIYYGEEIGMDGAKPDPQIRTPMEWTSDNNGGFTTGTPWEPVNSDYTSKNVAAQEKDPNSLLSTYRKLIQIRNQHPSLRTGDLVSVDASNPHVYATLRTRGKDAILTLINLSDQPVSDYNINFSNSSLRGNYKLQALFGSGSFASLTVNDSGGASNYQPLGQLPGNAILILSLQSK